ncbi:MAG: protein translocase subunit SecD [Nitrospirae bacterium]|nr:protein translocase subunit SecD [Nitrospirota bacterium]MBI3595253.1 protein translocase subunit SecD [Nitrospirota bacterium]
MKKGIKGRIILISLTILSSIVFFLPSTRFYSLFPSWWGNIFPNKGINLGLDLQGGIHLVLEVEQDEAVSNNLDQMMAGIKDSANEKKIEVSSVKKVAMSDILIEYPRKEAKETLTKVINDQFPFLISKESKDNALLLTLSNDEASRIKENAVSQSMETIRNRIDQFGVAEPLIQRQGTNQILIQLPGIKNPQQALSLIKTTALLEFKLVDDENSFSRELPNSLKLDQEEKFKSEFGPRIPEGDEILFEKIVDKDSQAVTKRPFLIKKRTLLTGDKLSDARMSFDEYNKPYVSVVFDRTGSKQFETITAENVRKRLAIILDGTVYSAPVIQDRILGGRAQISGGFTPEEATSLAIVLRAGALPAPVKTIQNVTVGPSLGRDSIEMGFRAAKWGTLLVVVFMIFYYRLAGLIADFALVLNVILLIGALAALNATLTLPGIAGIILTIGMSVDSNVLIFERIREELRLGKPVRGAIDSGYDKAFLTIIDSHVTTLITALVLFIFGTGPIKGFAVSLSLGVTINLFTSLVGTKVIFDMITMRKKIETLSI